MSFIRDGWFWETNEQWPGFGVGLGVEKVLYQEKSKYQDILVFKSTTFGNVLVLDGCIQCSDRDEFCYQEMIVHLPLCCHSDPRQVLVVGGGDGGVVREILKHPSVERVVLCEIDEMVVEVSKKFLPNMAKCLSDPRVQIHIGDGIKFTEEHKAEFDIIITDAPDPIGAAIDLYKEGYYKSLRAALKPNGIICSQAENLWIDLHVATALFQQCQRLFPRAGYAFAGMPTYASGQIGFVLATTNPDIDFADPCKKLTEEQIKAMDLRFYNTDVHKAAFVLPQYAKEAMMKQGAESSAVNGNT
ncbi:hypothetical protein ACJMK2_012709 [Sinanodonta woodiana]|uniref:Spermidine synthase n=1 Tax=Sinanodonta woodiana TaxID=1069815 RepID=A0ABD3VBF8_SINWO